MSDPLEEIVLAIAQQARAASLVLATASADSKNAALLYLAERLSANVPQLLQANAKDLADAKINNLPTAQTERLTLTAARIDHLAQSVRQVAALPDPVGENLEEISRPNGLKIKKVRVPIGVIGIIYEARPNVTVDCAILCLKSGNASILRGGKEIFHTNTAFAALISESLVRAGLPSDAVQLIPTTDRAALNTLLKLDQYVHCIIPRGGESLIRFVTSNSTIPVLKHYQGVCFVYVDLKAEPSMAERIVINAKTSRVSVCNATEQLLVHRAVAGDMIPRLARALRTKNVQIRCDIPTSETLNRAGFADYVMATEADYRTEFLDYIIAIRVVDSVEEAISTINRDGSSHTDAIITSDELTAKRFLAEVDSAVVVWNASTRFNDGFEFGFGAEIGISTDRLHARGPMGLKELCSYKYLVTGHGQVRE